MSDGHLDQLRRAALDYHGMGLSVLPVSKKKPVVKWKAYANASAGHDTIEAWFDPARRGRPVTGVAVVLGPVSGDLIVRDFDIAEAYHGWAAEHPGHAGTLPTVKTARGFHVYARITNVGTVKFDDGELRGDGAYVVAPPSLHESGCTYEWIVPLEPDVALNVDAGVFGLDSRIRTPTSSWPADLVNPEYPEYLVSTTELREYIEQTFLATLPETTGQRDGNLMLLARRLKARPELADKPAAELLPILREWHRRAYPTIGTKSLDVTRAAFVRAWGNVHTPYGVTMDGIVRKARAASNPKCAGQYDDERTHLLIRLCKILSQRYEDGVFWLACRQAGSAIGLSHTAAADLLHMLVQDGVLALVRRGERRRSSVYRYLGD
ncbi:MAG: bifunctional DNA primase/polymerase [Phycisphaerales bacterium]|nr:bifunctional DNA primase/polymerase [Phycisphaerales bacterium]